MIRYTTSIDGITPDMLSGFFVGWPDPPSPAKHLKILKNSACVVLAVDDSDSRVIGFVNAISDGILSSYSPLLEVLPERQGNGIGKALIETILGELQGLYQIDVLCDEPTVPFYLRCGFLRATGAMIRNRESQSGRTVG